jgi:glycosyltransferase involved in cell wall biosynthesis
MKILHVIRSLRRESGGPLEGLLRLSEALISKGHEVELLGLDTEEEAVRLAVPFQVTALGPGIGQYGYNPRLHQWLRSNASRFDVVVSHGLWNYSSIGTWRALSKHQTPYFVFVHGMMSRWFRNSFPAKHLAKQVLWLLLEGRVLRDARYALFTTEGERIDARNVFLGHQYYKERIVPYGTFGPVGDQESQKRAVLAAIPNLEGRRFLLFVGRLHKVKGCDLLIQAFAQSIANIPLDTDLVIAGPDQMGLTAKLKAQAYQLGISKRVHWTGMVEGDLKWGLFQTCEALILPSHHENFGMVVVEAMSCSRPVLISDKVSIWREIAASSGGVIEPDTLGGTCQLITKFYAMAEGTRLRMGLNAKRGFHTYFDMEVVAHEFARAIGFERDAPRDSVALKRMSEQTIRAADPLNTV